MILRRVHCLVNRLAIRHQSALLAHFTNKRPNALAAFSALQNSSKSWLPLRLIPEPHCFPKEMDPSSSKAKGQAPANAIDLTGEDDGTADSGDEELRNAISLSLEQHDDSDDEDLKAAIALSLESGGDTSRDLSDIALISSKDQTTKEPQKTTKSRGVYGILGLDRRHDEAARLERLKRKRESSISPPTLGRKTTIPIHQPLDRNTTTKSLSFKATDSQASIKPEAPSGSGLQYPNGVIKKTWAFGYPRSDDIKIEELLQRQSLQAAVLSSFQWNMEWLFSKFDTARTKFVLVMQAQTKELQEQYRSETADMKNLRLCFPPMDGQVFCMHSKLMLLFYEDSLRIAVPTANLTDYDWGEMGGVMENSCFVIDLPKLSMEAVKTGDTPTTSFQESLLYFLQAQNMQRDVIEKIELFDFQRTARLGFVHSIGGSHVEEDWRKTGICGLGATIHNLGLSSTLPISLDYIASSIGSLNDDFLRSLYLAAQGDDGLAALQLANKIPKNSTFQPLRQVSRENGDQWHGNLRVYFPSMHTVRSSKGGPDCAGTICFQRKWYDSRFPKHVMRDCVSSRPGLLMHNKVQETIPQRLLFCSSAQLTRDRRLCTYDLLNAFSYVMMILVAVGCTWEVRTFLKVPGMSTVFFRFW